jgi:tRNA(fMet)-specific endonuclease VapC
LSGYILDTNVVSAVLQNRAEVVARLTEVTAAGEEIALAAICYFEARRGLLQPHFAKKLAAFGDFAHTYGVLALELPELDLAADVYQNLRRRGVLIEDADILIAATALARDATLVTRNLKHFARIEGLTLESWEA